MKLRPCHWCGAPVGFHTDPVDCEGCHVIACTGCGLQLDFFPTSHPANPPSIERFRSLAAREWNKLGVAET
jgi:hypothetical protein